MVTPNIWRGRALAVLAVLAVVSGCGRDAGDAAQAPGPDTETTTSVAPADAAGDDERRGLWLTFSEVGEVVVDSALSNDGTAPAVVSIVNEDQGRLARVSGPDGATPS